MVRKSKELVVLLVICLVIGMAGVAFAATDIGSHWAGEQIQKWVSKGLASGYPDGTFKPNNQITRAEFVALANRAFEKQNPAATVSFKDVKSTDWYYAEVAAAKAAGYISGYEDGTFRPNSPISRQEAASIVSRLLNLEVSDTQATFSDAASIPAWSKGAINAVVANNIMGGYPDGTFKPANNITRAEAVVTLDRALTITPPSAVLEGIKGQVTLNGKAVEGAVVNLFAKGGKEVLKTMKTGKDGKYEFKVTAGTYDLTAAKNNYVTYAATVSVFKDIVKDLVLTEGTVVKGQLKDKNGNPIKNAKLLCTTNPTFIVTTDNSGNFQITVPSGMSYSVWGFKDNNPALEFVKIGEFSSGSVGTLTLAPFATQYVVSTPASGGGGGASPVIVTSVTISPAALNLDREDQGGQPVTLTATVLPANATNKNLTWSSDNPAIASVDKNGKVTPGSVAGKTVIRATAQDGSGIQGTCNVTVYTVVSASFPSAGGSVTLQGSNDPVKLIATVGNLIVDLGMDKVPVGASISLTPVDFNILPPPDPNVPFLGLTIAPTGFQPGTVFTVVFPLPAGLDASTAGAYHFNSATNLWEYREVTVVDGKIIFKTTLSPVGVSKRVGVPQNLTVTGVTSNSVSLSWNPVVAGVGQTIAYNVYRNGSIVNLTRLPSTTYTDTGLASSTKYTYYVVAYRQPGGSHILFESNKSASVDATTLTDLTLPKIISFAGRSPDNANTINVPLSKIGTSTGIEVSTDCKLALNVEGLGTVRQLPLKTGVNNINNILIPDAKEIDVSKLDLSKLFNATKNCPPATKEQVYKAVNFTGLFEILKSKPGIKDDIIDKTNLGQLLDTVSNDKNIKKGEILKAVNIEEVLDTLRGNITKDDIKKILSRDDLLKIIIEIEDDNLYNQIVTAISDLLDANTNYEVSDALKELFVLINQTEESTKDEIAQAINYTALFDVVKKVDNATKEDVFKAINFTALFNAMSGASDDTIAKIIDVTIQIIGIMRQHNITRSEILNNIKFNELDKESIFNWLSRIDQNHDVLTIQAILTNNVGENTYTIKITK